MKLTRKQSDEPYTQDRREAIERIGRGLESMKRNAGKPAEKFFREFFAEKGISEREETLSRHGPETR